MDREMEHTIEQLNLRYSGSYVRMDNGLPVLFSEARYEEDWEDIVVSIRKANRSISEVDIDRLSLNPWGYHFTLYLPKWKGCIVVEKTNARQVKRGVQTRTCNIIHDVRSPFFNNASGSYRDRRNFWYDVVRAMSSPVFFDLGTCADAMEEDKQILSMPISANACMLRDGTILYHGRIIGSMSDIERSPWWSLINKEAV